MDTLPPHDLDDNPYTIYALIDPRTADIKYVGMSTDPERRLREHFRDREAPCKYAWLDELRMLDLSPAILPLELGMPSEQEAREQEKFWIKVISEAGEELFNLPSTVNRGRKQGVDRTKRILSFYQDFGVFPDDVSPKMQRYYKREYPKVFRRRRARKGRSLA